MKPLLISLFVAVLVAEFLLLPNALALEWLHGNADATTIVDQLEIGAVGDIILHEPLQRQVIANRGDYSNLWSESVAQAISEVDLMYGNLEGPSAFGVNVAGSEVRDPGLVYDGVVYSGFPRFNYHASLLDALRGIGFDIVSTANNHATDRGSLGIDRTIEALRRSQLPFSGTRQASSSSFEIPVITARSMRLAIVSCAETTNDLPGQSQVLRCTGSRVIRLIQEQLREGRADAVVVTAHWGQEYQPLPREDQIQAAHQFLEAGAIAVLGSHPHVLQPWERYRTRNGRETFVIYSLGNFIQAQDGTVSAENRLSRNTSVFLKLGLAKLANGSVVIRRTRVMPLAMIRRGGSYQVEFVDQINRSDSQITFLQWARRHVVRIFGENSLWSQQ